MSTEKGKIGDSLGKLQAILAWFEGQKDVDVEEGLKKVKEGKVLIKDLGERLKAVENEFQEIKKDLVADNGGSGE
ncbi:MAG: exodeoxyribonuclease VII small subunit [bacterium]|nr:exodeoxyribonuclease VII small subunit [bacterium]MDZ4296353.1 exodeoxyribonuclease VII small subunit [Patescibacteria group bacterium]